MMSMNCKARVLVGGLLFAATVAWADQQQDAMAAYSTSNYDQAFQLMQKPASDGNAEAQFWMGIMHSRGQGVKLDATKAVDWWKKAAAKNNVPAQSALAESYTYGVGTAKNYKQALRYAQIVADQNIPNGQQLLGALYENGWGVKANPSEAYKWYSIAVTTDGNFVPSKEGITRLEKVMKPEQVIAAKAKAQKWLDAQKSKQEAAKNSKQEVKKSSAKNK